MRRRCGYSNGCRVNYAKKIGVGATFIFVKVQDLLLAVGRVRLIITVIIEAEFNFGLFRDWLSVCRL